MRALLLALCICLSACASWKPVSTATLTGDQELGSVVVFLHEGQPVWIGGATVVGDSIVGQVAGERHAYAVADLNGVQRRGVDAGRAEFVAKPVHPVMRAVAVGIVQTLVVLSQIGDALRIRI